MDKLIKFQLRNIFHQKYFLICLIINLLFTVIIEAIESLNLGAFNQIEVFPNFISYFCGGADFISLIFVAIFSTIDFDNETAKNIIARGYTKKEFLLSKYIGSIIGVFTMYIILFIASIIVFSINGFGYESKTLLIIINNFFQIIAFITLYTTISFTLEKCGISIIVSFYLLPITESIITIFTSKLNININNLLFNNISNNFYEVTNLNNLIFDVTMYIIYTIIFIIIGILLTKRKEIK